uniref:Protein NUCLEAR FUSION DEFECTIVE 6, chloroplastic/mitochondrial-like n=1 Tax=Chenopodium quinoa TaxID=63459 RepID=A0A803LP57_CHEQI
MATMGIRSAMASGARLMAVRSKPSSFSLTPKQLLASSSSNRPISSASRLASMLGMVESQKPLHSAIASARLTSILALDSSCWSCLSLGDLI